MKKILFATAPSLIAAVLFIAVATGCNKSSSGGNLPSTVVSAEKNSFKEVTAKLDAGGSFYLYLSTEQLLEGLSGKVAAWRSLFDAIPDMDDTARMKVGKVFDLVTGLIKDSGLEDISGFGMSSVVTDGGIYYTKAFLHHYPGKGKGFLWNLCGEKAHPLAGLKMLPADTALVVFSDMDVSLGWSLIKDQVRRLGIVEVESGMNQLPALFERGTGLSWEKVLGSLGGEFGIVLTLSESKMIPLPIPGTGPIQLPEPGLAIVIKVKDDTIFNRVDQALTQMLANGPAIVRVDDSDLKMRTVPLPLPLPIEVRPTIASSGGYLFISVSDATIQEMFAVSKGKKPGLESTDEFKRLSKNVPTEGNQFCFVSKRLGKTFIQIQKEVMQNKGGPNDAAAKFFMSMADPEKSGVSFSVSANTDEGWLTVGNGNQHPAKVLAAATVVPVMGMLAAIAVPNFVKARGTAQKNACLNNLRMIDVSKQQWALENNKKETDIPTQADLQKYMSDRSSWPVCPQGGHYTIRVVGEKPTCTVPGHQLPD